MIPRASECSPRNCGLRNKNPASAMFVDESRQPVAYLLRPTGVDMPSHPPDALPFKIVENHANVVHPRHTAQVPGNGVIHCLVNAWYAGASRGDAQTTTTVDVEAVEVTRSNRKLGRQAPSGTSRRSLRPAR